MNAREPRRLRSSSPRGLRRPAREGMTLVEVVIATAVLAVLVTATMAAAWPLARATNAATLALDMDREARDFLAQLRREVRQSGWRDPGGAQFTTTPAVTGGPFAGETWLAETGSIDRDGDGATTGTSEVALQRQLALRMRLTESTWGEWITYGSVPDGGRRSVRRLRGSPAATAIQTTALRNVADLLFREVGGAIEVVLVLERNDPHAPAALGRTIRRIYEERIDMQNIDPN